MSTSPEKSISIDYQSASRLIDAALQNEFYEKHRGADPDLPRMNGERRAMAAFVFSQLNLEQFKQFRNDINHTDDGEPDMSRYDHAWIDFATTLAIMRGTLRIENIEPGQEISWRENLDERILRLRKTVGARSVELVFCEARETDLQMV